MKLKTMLYGLTLVLGCFVLASCINDEEGPCLPDGKTQVIFSLVLPDNAQTRAMWSANSDWINGEDKDNDIDLSTIRVAIFDNDGAYIGTLGDELTYLPKETGTDPYEKTVYECIGTVPEAIATKLTSASVKNFKFVVFANCTVPESITWAGLQTAVVFDSDTDKIPMWGVLSVENLTLTKGERTTLGDIVLLRALSKVTVALTPNAGEEAKMAGFEFINSVKVTNYNTKGYAVPTLPETYAGVTNTMALDDEECVNENTSEASTDLVIEGSTETKELTFWLLEFVNKGKEDAAQAQLIVTLGKTETNADTGEETVTTKDFDFAPIKFCAYENGTPTTTAYDIVRNHYYKFNITEVVGGLYVVPTVADWIDAPVLDYTINMSTNMRLFDSWLYRYDTDGTYGKGGTDSDAAYNHWAESHMVVSDGRMNVSSETEPIAGRPLHSPQIQLVTTGTGTFELFVDNTDFEIVRANKNDVGVVTSYEASLNGTLTIASGEDVYTYFYIVPKLNTVPSEPVAKVFLYYNDPVLGKQEVTYNYSSLPGYSDDSSEIWVYYVSEAAYDAGQIDETNKFMKMYYQDAGHPLVPVQP